MTTLRGAADPSSLIVGLARTPDRLASLVGDASDTALDAAQTGEWSARTVVAHLRDDEFMVGRLRVVRILVEDHPALTPFDERAWAESKWNAGDPVPDLLADFRAQREATLMILRRLQDSDWRRTGFQPEIGEFDLNWFVEDWLEHDENHLAQIAAALGAAL
jgi:hypothetical protein